MVNEQLLNYTKQARQSGKNDEQIRQELINVGWSENDINEALVKTLSITEEVSGQVSGIKGFKNWRLNHSVFWSIILSITLIFITRYIASGTPELNIFYLLTLWFVAPILVFGAIYKSLARKSKNISDSIDDADKINKKQAKLVLILLALEIPVLLLMLYVFIGNQGSRYGDYGVMIFIFGVTLFVPNLIAFIIFGLGYIKGVIRYWRQLSKYSRASFFVFLVQFVLYLTFLSYF